MLEHLFNELERLEAEKAELYATIAVIQYSLRQRTVEASETSNSEFPVHAVIPILESKSSDDWNSGPMLCKRDGPEFFPLGTNIDALRQLNFTLLPDGLPVVSHHTIASLRKCFTQVTEISSKAALVQVCIQIIKTTPQQEEALLECLRLIRDLWVDPLVPVYDPEDKILFAHNMLKLLNITPPPIGEMPCVEAIELIKDRGSHLQIQWIKWENTFSELLRHVEESCNSEMVDSSARNEEFLSKVKTEFTKDQTGADTSIDSQLSQNKTCEVPAADDSVHYQQVANSPVEQGENELGKKRAKKGENKELIVAVLAKHHEFDGDSCLNYEPITVTDLANQAGVNRGRASEFFTANFKGYKNYKTQCHIEQNLIASMKMLRGELNPHLLNAGLPADKLLIGDESGPACSD